MTGVALVLGASGLLGSHLRAELKQRGLATTGTSTNGRGETLALDITDPVAVSSLIGEVEPELVFHAAGMSSVSESWQRPEQAFRRNSTGVLTVLEAIRNQAPEAHLVLASSAAVYGPPTESLKAQFDEESPVRPSSPYAASKAAAEVLCGQYSRQEQISISVARIFNQVGPGQDPNQVPSELAREIVRAERAEAREIGVPLGNPTAERDFTDIRDTARAMVDLGDSRTQGTFNICSGQATSLIELVRLLGESTPLEVSIADKPDHVRPADIQRIVGSNERLKAATGWKPEIPLQVSLADLLEDWRTRGL